MTEQKKYNTDGKTSEDRALDLFADMMIERIKSLSSKDGWKKPWFTEGSLSWPKNLSGREYNGMNALMLMMHCEKNGYKLPIFCTFLITQVFPILFIVHWSNPLNCICMFYQIHSFLSKFNVTDSVTL